MIEVLAMYQEHGVGKLGPPAGRVDFIDDRLLGKELCCSGEQE
jgi:hypothetical protein